MIYELSSPDEALCGKRKKRISAIYMCQLAAQIAVRQNDYTAQTGLRGAGRHHPQRPRILLQWIDAQLVDIVGEEKVAARAAPAIYRLTFVRS